MKTLTAILVFLFCFVTQNVNSQLKFIENKGQLLTTQGKSANDVLFYSDAGNVRYLIRKTGISYVILDSKQLAVNKIAAGNMEESFSEHKKNYESQIYKGWRIDMNWQNTSPSVQAIGQLPLKQKFNYYTPQFPNGLLDILSFEKILVKSIYKNIDILFYSKNNQLKYDYIIHKGGNFKQIKFGFEGADVVKLEGDTLNLIVPNHVIKDFIPQCYTVLNGKNNPVKMHFKQEANNFFTIESNQQINNFEKLIIDPSIWVTYFGGTDADYAIDLECDASGNIYIVGYTGSLDFPVTPGAFQTVFSSLAGQNIYLSKFNGAGVLEWSTYYSGTDYEEGRGVCVDGFGFVYIVGNTYSADFPITAGAYQTVIAGSADAFLVKFDNAGVRQFATYFGGTTFDIGHKVDKDDSNNIWITGGTTNNSFPTTAGAHDVSYNGGGNDVFVSKFTSAGAYLYGTFIGGSSQEYGNDIDFTPGFIGVTGNTQAAGFPTTAGAYDITVAGGAADGFYCKFDLTGALVYSTFLGGNALDFPASINFDGAGNAIIGGHTFSNNFPTTAGAYQTVFGAGGQDCFLAKFKPDNTIDWATYVGNNHTEVGGGVTIDEFDNIYLHAQWKNDAILDFPTLSCGFQINNAGGDENFIIKFDEDCNELCRTYLGGNLLDAVDIPGACIDYHNSFLHLANYTEGNFPVTAGAYQTTFAGYYDIGLAKLCSIGCGDILSSVADFTVDDSVCVNWPLQFNASGISCDTSLIVYQWNFTGGTPSTSSIKDPSVMYSATGVYPATLTVMSPCDTTTQTVNITVVSFGALSVTISASEDTICLGDAITITSSVLGGTAPYNYQWTTSGADTLPTLVTSPTSSGPITLFVDNPTSCPAVDAVTITVLTLPALTAPVNTCICLGSSITLTASGAPSYSWDTGENTASITVSPTNNTTYLVTYSNGTCSVSDSTIICVNPLPFVVACDDTTFSGLENYDGIEVELCAVGDAPFVWTPSTGLSCNPCSNPTALVIYTTTYTVTVTNAFGCTAADQQTITTEFDLLIPNIVTPNGDGLNDKFYIQGLPPKSSMSIFNRWGNLLHTSTDYKNDWSTTSEGVYYYIFTTEKGKQYNGFFHIAIK